jgi:hypothetical protein
LQRQCSKCTHDRARRTRYVLHPSEASCIAQVRSVLSQYLGAVARGHYERAIAVVERIANQTSAPARLHNSRPEYKVTLVPANKLTPAHVAMWAISRKRPLMAITTSCTASPESVCTAGPLSEVKKHSCSNASAAKPHSSWAVLVPVVYHRGARDLSCSQQNDCKCCTSPARLCLVPSREVLGCSESTLV